jgi:hypothetical protein
MATNDTAAKVKAQLSKDFPPEALTWVDSIKWNPGVEEVQTADIDQTYHPEELKAAKARTTKVREFVQKIKDGFKKPSILLHVPGRDKYIQIDGHTRYVAHVILKQPLPAYCGTAPKAHGPWETTHSQQKGRPVKLANEMHDDGGKFSRTSVPMTSQMAYILKTYQETHGLKVTGELDEATHKHISDSQQCA